MNRSFRRGLVFAVALLGVAGSSVAQSITVEAWIDGRSQLILKDNTAQWHHLDFSAPGREGGVTEPTTINGAEWYPVWPDVPDANNSFCDCSSDVYTGVVPPIPETGFPAKLNLIQARDDAYIVQQPDAGNDYELIVEFNDNASGGADWYIVELQVSGGIPVLAHWGIVLFAVLMAGTAVVVLRRHLAAA
jgi:hypothetical protein